MSAAHIVFWCWVGFGALIAAIIYIGFVTIYLKSAAISLGDDIEAELATGWNWLVCKVRGWKTVILAGIAASAQLLSQIDITSISGLPWGTVLDPKTAAYITIVCAVLIPLTHVVGYHRAAVTPPKG